MKAVRDLGMRTGKGMAAKELVIECQVGSPPSDFYIRISTFPSDELNDQNVNIVGIKYRNLLHSVDERVPLVCTRGVRGRLAG